MYVSAVHMTCYVDLAAPVVCYPTRVLEFVMRFLYSSDAATGSGACLCRCAAPVASDTCQTGNPDSLPLPSVSVPFPVRARPLLLSRFFV